MVQMCTGARAMHTFGKSVYQCNEEVISLLDDTSLRPDSISPAVVNRN